MVSGILKKPPGGSCPDQALIADMKFQPGAFVAVPLFRVNHYPMGPHPAGSYESEEARLI